MRPLDESLPLKLLRAREAVMERFRPHLHAHNITDQQWRVLRALAERGAMDAGTLARTICLMLPSLSRILRDLSGRGLLKRTRKPGDGRSVIVSLTPKGRSLFERMAEESGDIYREIERIVGEGRLSAIMRDMDLLTHLLHPQPAGEGTRASAATGGVAAVPARLEEK